MIREKNYPKDHVSNKKVLYLHHALFRTCICREGLKGNRVKIPNSPAAVSFNNVSGNTFATVLSEEWEGARYGSKSEDLQGILFQTASRKGRKRKSKAYNAFTILIPVPPYCRLHTLFLIILP